jgi:hypothetical protein
MKITAVCLAPIRGPASRSSDDDATGLVSPHFCQYFGKVLDDTVGHKWKDTVQILEEDLGVAAVAL